MTNQRNEENLFLKVPLGFSKHPKEKKIWLSNNCLKAHPSPFVCVDKTHNGFSYNRIKASVLNGFFDFYCICACAERLCIDNYQSKRLEKKILYIVSLILNNKIKNSNCISWKHNIYDF